jgi:hypothetical protein
MHLLHILMHGYAHIHNRHALMTYYRHYHRAVRFLLSGLTSETPPNARAARRLLVWLGFHHISPVDW